MYQMHKWTRVTAIHDFPVKSLHAAMTYNCKATWFTIDRPVFHFIAFAWLKLARRIHLAPFLGSRTTVSVALRPLTPKANMKLSGQTMQDRVTRRRSAQFNALAQLSAAQARAAL